MEGPTGTKYSEKETACENTIPPVTLNHTLFLHNSAMPSHCTLMKHPGRTKQRAAEPPYNHPSMPRHNSKQTVIASKSFWMARTSLIIASQNTCERPHEHTTAWCKPLYTNKTTGVRVCDQNVTDWGEVGEGAARKFCFCLVPYENSTLNLTMWCFFQKAFPLHLLLDSCSRKALSPLCLQRKHGNRTSQGQKNPKKTKNPFC